MEDTLLPTVAVVNAEPPDFEIPCHAVYRLMDYLGGIEQFIVPDSEVVLLVNLRHLHAVSYLCLVSGIAGLVQAAGATVAIGDSPWLTTERVDTYWRSTGANRLASHRGWRLLEFEHDRLQSVAVRSHVYYVPEVVLKASAVINIAPVMRHRICGLAGGMFNLLGMLPGYKRGQFPGRRFDVDTACEVCTDLLSIVQPDLTVLDASPVSRHTQEEFDCRRRLLASTDAVAVDCMAAASLGLDPGSVASIRLAAEAGLGIGWPEGVEQLGDASYPLRPSNLAWIEGDCRLKRPAWLRRLYQSVSSFRVQVNPEVCRPCDECTTGCPTGALRLDQTMGLLTHVPAACITCFQCLSHCSRGALSVQPSWLTSRLI